jgi:hypothetical protein
MGAYYIYLISSLPMLSFSSRPPFGLEDFLAKCKGLIPEAGLEFLRDACYKEASILNLGAAASGMLVKWVNFEIALRNELARGRARRKKIDVLKFIHFPDEPEAYISHVAMAAYRSSSVLEAEKILDQARWDFLEFLSLGHYFDFDFLMFYLLKLKILDRWDKVQKADKEYLFNQVAGN